MKQGETNMNWNELAMRLFGSYHGMRATGDFLQGDVVFEGQPITVIGTTNHAPIGVALALAQARVVLDTIAQHPVRPILLLIDTQGQQLRRRDETLGINRAMAAEVLAPIDTTALAGKQVTVTGAFRLINPSNWLITPVALEVQ